MCANQTKPWLSLPPTQVVHSLVHILRIIFLIREQVHPQDSIQIGQIGLLLMNKIFPCVREGALAPMTDKFYVSDTNNTKYLETEASSPTTQSSNVSSWAGTEILHFISDGNLSQFQSLHDCPQLQKMFLFLQIQVQAVIHCQYRPVQSEFILFILKQKYPNYFSS